MGCVAQPQPQVQPVKKNVIFQQELLFQMILIREYLRPTVITQNKKTPANAGVFVLFFLGINISQQVFANCINKVFVFAFSKCNIIVAIFVVTHTTLVIQIN